MKNLKRSISFIIMLVMSVTLISPAQMQKVQAAETKFVSNWAINDLIYGDTYGIYPLDWYEDGVTGNISQAKFRILYYGVRKKIVYSENAEEVRFEKPVIDDSITVEEALEAFYTLLSNYDYTGDPGLGAGLDPVVYMQQIGVYTGQNGEQGLEELCSIEQAMVIATRIIAVVYDSLDVSSKGFLWEIKSGDNTAYLLGSIHLASNEIYPFSNDMWKAYYNSDALYVEADLYDQEDIAAFYQLMCYTDGTTLKDHVSEEVYQKAIEAAALLGIPEEKAAYIKPWELYLIFENYMVAGTSNSSQIQAFLGIDMTFLTNAYLYKKPIYSLESLKEQGEMMDSFSNGLQEYLLDSTSDYIKNMQNGVQEEEETAMDEMIDSMFEYWKNGDIEGFKNISSGDEGDVFTGELTDEQKGYSEEYQEKMLTQRNKGMADDIDSLLKAEGSNTYFIIVGSAHYISGYSVIDRLQEMGYEVKQIK